MDENTRLIIASTEKPENWEDREKATDDLAILREEFRKRLYPQQGGQEGAQDGQPKTTDK